MYWPNVMTLKHIGWAWLALVALTLAGVIVGSQNLGAAWLPYGVALLIWGKCALVCRYFLESQRAHYRIKYGLTIFVVFSPLALLLTSVLTGS